MTSASVKSGSGVPSAGMVDGVKAMDECLPCAQSVMQKFYAERVWAGKRTLQTGWTVTGGFWPNTLCVKLARRPFTVRCLLCPVALQQRRHFLVSLPKGEAERRLAVVVHGIDVSAAFDEQFGNWQPVE